jgi:hypothetical protein
VASLAALAWSRGGVHRRKDSAPTPTFGPITWQAAHTTIFNAPLTLLDRVVL